MTKEDQRKALVYERVKKWKQANKERDRMHRQKYYRRNRDRILSLHKEYDKTRGEYFKSYRLTHKEIIKEKNKRRRLAGKEKRREQLQKWRMKNKEKVLTSARKYREDNRNRINLCRRNNHQLRYQTDVKFKLMATLRSRLNAIFRFNKVQSSTTFDLIGCTLDQLKLYLESKFQDGMSWQNHTLDGWHIDHIKPCASFDLSDSEQQKQCFHYTNLQPLWGVDNLSKGAKVAIN